MQPWPGTFSFQHAPASGRLRFGDSGPKGPTYSETLKTIGKTLWLDNVGRFHRAFLDALLFRLPTEEDNARRIEEKLWRKVFAPLLAQPEEANALIQSWKKSIASSLQPVPLKVVQGLLVEHVRDNLHQPAVLKNTLGLATRMLTMGGGLKGVQSLAETLQAPDFQRLALKHKVQTGIHQLSPFLAAFLQYPDRTKPFCKALETTLGKANLPQTTRQGLLFTVRHLQQQVDSPTALKQDLAFLQTLLANGGIEKLEHWGRLFQTPAYQQAPPAYQGHLILTGLEPVVETLLSHPEQARSLLQSVKKTLATAYPKHWQHQLAQKTLAHLEHNLTDPQWIRQEYQLVETFLKQGGHRQIKPLMALLASGNNTHPPEKMADQLHQALLPVLQTASAHSDITRVILTRLSRAVDQRFQPGIVHGTARFLLEHLDRLLDNPKALENLAHLTGTLLANGGLAKLKQIRGLMASGQLQAADAKQQGEWLTEGLEPLGMALLSKPAEVKQTLSNVETTLTGQYEPSLVRDSVLLFLKHLKNTMDKPEKLKKAVDLTRLILNHGGFEKLNNLNAVVQTDSFKTASPERQGQLLLEGLGPIFVKAFQTVSTMPDLFPPHIQASMKKLYEDLTPLPFAEIRQIVEQELGKPLEEAFDGFDPTPLKVGSIAQVHKAKIGNQQVAVKIVKPDVPRLMAEDLDLLKPLVDLGQQMAPHLDAETFYNAFRDHIENEANMSAKGNRDGEAQNLKRLAAVYKDHATVVVPDVFDTHTTPNMLTMAFMNGKSLLNYKGNAQVAQGYLSMLLEQIFTNGACQADPHPGNVLYNEETKKFACIDAGLLYFSTPEERIRFAKLLVSLYTKNVHQISMAVLAPGMTERPEYDVFKDRIAVLPLDRSSLDYKATMKYLNEVCKIAQQVGLETQLVSPLLWKSLFTAVNVAKTLDPTVSIVSPAVFKLATLFLTSKEPSFLLTTTWDIASEQVSQAARKGYLGEKIRRFFFGDK